jgi:hypothetical protein
MIDNQDALIAAGKYDDTDVCKFYLEPISKCRCRPELGITDADLPDWWKKMQQEAQ